MSPSYIFRIDEFTEHKDAAEKLDNRGKWIPYTTPGYNVRKSGGVSGQYWFCDRTNLHLLKGWTPPEGSRPYKVFSTVYGDGHGLWVLKGDATNPPKTEAWNHLWFEWDENRLSSALTNAGDHSALRVQDAHARWPKMLLPDIYHGPHYNVAGYGGLTGDLPIFLGLIALSMRPERLPTELPNMMQNGDWGVHQRSHGRQNKRGVIVYVYAYGDNEEELEQYERGEWGFYYN